MSTFPTQSPVIVENGSFLVERKIDRTSQLESGVGDLVEPDTIIARTDTMEKSFTLYLANELAVPNDSLRKYLAKSIGSSVTEGEPIARVRRGLRTAAVKSPATGTLVHVDDNDGTVTLSTSTGPKEISALVHGVIENVDPDNAISIRTEGARVYGVIGFGGEAHGKLVVGSDRHDRELTADQVSDEWRGAVVLAGMTVGVPALKKMREQGVAAVIVGSISESDVRRHIGSDESNVGTFWGRYGELPGGARSAPVVIVTEGFGRLPMADPVYEFLASQAGNTVSVSAATRVGRNLARPEILIHDRVESESSANVDLTKGRMVRVSDSHRLGAVGTVQSDTQTMVLKHGVRRDVVAVQFEDGSTDLVPLENVEVLV